MRLDNEQIRLTVIPEQGSQVWAYARISILKTLQTDQEQLTYAQSPLNRTPPLPGPNSLLTQEKKNTGSL